MGEVGHPAPTRCLRTGFHNDVAVDEAGTTHHEELVVHVDRRESVERVTAVAPEVGARSGSDL